MEAYVQKAVDLIKEFEPMALKMDSRGYCVCSSFGKDSVALIKVFQLAKVKFFIQYNITGVDPPQLVYFARREIERLKNEGAETLVVKPRISMYSLIIKKRMPPTRLVRYCCNELKERRIEETKGCFFSFGVRKAESVKRSKRGALEVLNRKNPVVADLDLRENEQIVFFNDNSEKRQMFENCTVKGVRAINPIIWWTDEELWQFINQYNIPYCELYDQGYKRLGCIGCPMNSKTYLELEKFPKFKQYYINAFEKMVEKRKQDGLATDWKNGQDVYDWWINQKRK